MLHGERALIVWSALDPYESSDIAAHMRGRAAQLMKVREPARTLGVHANTVGRWEERGLLRAVLACPGPGDGRSRTAPGPRDRLAAMLVSRALAEALPRTRPHAH